jgi:hypothetical protein
MPVLMRLCLHLLTFIVGITALAAAIRAAYGLVLSFKRWTAKKRLTFLFASVLAGVLGFFVAFINAPYAELWTIQLWAVVFMVYVASWLVVWQNRGPHQLTPATWRERTVTFVLSQLFYFCSAAGMSWISGGVIDWALAECTVISAFAFGCLTAYVLSHKRLHIWPHTILTTQVFWIVAYAIEFFAAARFGGFWAMPFLALMFFFFPAIMVLVWAGAWLGHRVAQFRHAPSKATWAEVLLAP